MHLPQRQSEMLQECPGCLNTEKTLKKSALVLLLQSEASAAVYNVHHAADYTQTDRSHDYHYLEIGKMDIINSFHTTEQCTELSDSASFMLLF